MSSLLAAAASVLVFCAPGYPGGAGDAKPYVEQFAKTAAAAAGWPEGSLSAEYDPSEQGGLAKLGSADAVLAFVPYPFFVEHATELKLTPLAQADVVGTGTKERWTLVAKAGRVTDAASLAGFTILSSAGYAPEFVRHLALATWQLPPSVKIESTGQMLSALRKMASGEPVVALLDQTEAAAMATLPFAGELRAVAQSAEVPVAVIAAVAARLPAGRASSFQGALLKMGHGPGADSLGSLRLQGFVKPDIPGHPARP